MAEQRAIIDIAAPQQRVWEAVSNVETWPEWMDEIKSAQTRTPGAEYELGQGVAGLGMPLKVRVVTAEEPTVLAVEQRQAGTTTHAAYRLTALDDRTTRVESTLESEGAVSGLVASVFGGSYTAMLEGALRNLKEFCEGQGGPGRA